MKLKRITAITATAMLAVSSLAGCSPKGGTITMATNAEFPPFEYVTSKDNALLDVYSGVDVAIGLAIADELGKTLVIDNMEFTSVLTAVPQDKADFAAAGMTIKPDRLESMDFSITYYTAQQAIIVSADNETIHAAEDLITAKVAAVNGYTGYEVCLDLGIQNLETFTRGTDAVMQLKSGRIDAVVIDLHTANSFAAQNEDLKVVYDEENFDKEEYAIAVKKGNTELLNTINKVLQRLLDEGQINAWADENMAALNAN